MDEELKELLEKANANYAALAKKYASQQEMIEKLHEKAKDDDEVKTQLKELLVKSEQDRQEMLDFKNDMADLEKKLSKPSIPTKDQVEAEQGALTSAVKTAVGKFLKSKSKDADVAEYIAQETKALNLTNTGEGLESVDEVLSREIIQRAREAYPIIGEVLYSVMPRQMRQEVLISYPSIGDGIENVAGSDISETDTQTYGEVVNKVAKFYAQPRITNEALHGSDLDLFGQLMTLLDDEMGRKVAVQILFGNGAGKNFRGILSSNRLDLTNVTGESWKPTIGVGARDLDYYPAFGTGVSADLPATDVAIVNWLIDMQVMLPSMYLNGAKWTMNRRTYARFQKVRDAQDRPIFSANYQGAGVSILGYTVVLDDYMPDIGAADAPFIIFGNLKQAFRFCDGDLPVSPLLDPYTVKGCLLVYLEREYFEMVVKNDAIVVGAATTNS